MNWGNISWRMVVMAAGVVASLAVVWLVVIAPTMAARANRGAATAVSNAVQTVAPKASEAATKIEEKTNERIVQVERKRASQAVSASTNPDDSEFFRSLCDSELYRADQRCGSGGTKSR